MDAQRFDRLTRGLAGAGWTRRGLARLLTGTALAALLGATAPVAPAKRKGKKKPKKCKNGAVKCGKTCVNTGNNALHCGQCGLRCGDNRACLNGECQTGCPGNQILCNALCVDPGDNEQHCGGCNVPCTGELTCIGGQCACAGGTKCGNQCVDTQTDPEHCGACNDPCDDGDTCVAGQCNPSGCDPGEHDCGGGRCIPDGALACCSQADCGGPSSTDLRCENDVCVCFQSGIVGRRWGVCTRFSNGAGFCGPCCPGAEAQIGDRCAGENDELVCVSQTQAGCTCPPERPEICTSGNRTKCSIDTNRDPRVCGRFCQDCGNGHCCGGLCVGGCAEGFGGSCATGPCNGDCSPCGPGTICCNFGSGPACIENLHGGICFRP